MSRQTATGGIVSETTKVANPGVRVLERIARSYRRESDSEILRRLRLQDAQFDVTCPDVSSGFHTLLPINASGQINALPIENAF